MILPNRVRSSRALNLFFQVGYVGCCKLAKFALEATLRNCLLIEFSLLCIPVVLLSTGLCLRLTFDSQNLQPEITRRCLSVLPSALAGCPESGRSHMQVRVL